MSPQPTKLELTDDHRLRIEWNDATARLYTYRQLRSACPCASCREKRRAPPADSADNLLPVLSAEEAAPLTIRGMEPVGSYAYSINFSDGHDTGIFSFELLLSLGEREKSKP